MIQLGYIYANIAGDSRYTDRMEVQLDADTRLVHVIVSSSSPVGGMDGSGDTTGFEERLHMKAKSSSPKDVLKLVKSIIADERWNFKRYGQPTKRFTWRTFHGFKQGLNQTLVQEALMCSVD
jgi:hypothetical protein